MAATVTDPLFGRLWLQLQYLAWVQVVVRTQVVSYSDCQCVTPGPPSQTFFYCPPAPSHHPTPCTAVDALALFHRCMRGLKEDGIIMVGGLMLGTETPPDLGHVHSEQQSV